MNPSIAAPRAIETRVKLPVHLQAELEAALAEADSEQGVSVEALFEMLERRGSQRRHQAVQTKQGQ